MFSWDFVNAKKLIYSKNNHKSPKNLPVHVFWDTYFLSVERRELDRKQPLSGMQCSRAQHVQCGWLYKGQCVNMCSLLRSLF